MNIFSEYEDILKWTANYMSDVKKSKSDTMQEIPKTEIWHNEGQTLWGQFWPHMLTSS